MARLRYEFDEVRQYVSARQVAAEAGIRIDGNRSGAPWRSSERSDSVQYYDDGSFTDFGADDDSMRGGDGIRLYAILNRCDNSEACNVLGDRYCPHLEHKDKGGRKSKPSASRPAPAPPKEKEKVLGPEFIHSMAMQRKVLGAASVSPSVSDPPPANKLDHLLADGWEVMNEYHYTDADGEYRYTVVRLEKDGQKTFLQKTADGFHVKDLPRILYNLPEVAKASEVWVVEGEKDVETLRQLGLVGTTNSGGAKKWDDDFADDLRGKHVIVVADNDKEGRVHALTVVRSVYPVARSVKMVIPCPDRNKGDVTDYIDEGHTGHDLTDLARKTAPWIPERAGVVSETMRQEAKVLNQEPFRNFRKFPPVVAGQRERTEPVAMNDLTSEFFRRFLGYPYRLGLDQLFDQDRDTKKLENINGEDALFAWISRKSGHNYQWLQDSKQGFISKKEFYNAVKQTAKRFEGISMVPNYPEHENIYYTYPQLPAPSEGHRFFNGLCEFFAPKEAWHGFMLRTLFAAPMWFRPMMGRPSWVIDSRDGKGVGKSTLIEILAYLYQSEIISTSVDELYKHFDELIKKLVAENGRKCRIVCLDNLSVELSCGQFASLITQSNINGRAPYGSGAETRPNNLTYCVTCNGAQVDDDLVSRSYFISLAAHPANPNWKNDVIGYIDAHRWEIFADILDLLKMHRPFDIQPSTRYAEFEKEVLQPMCGTAENYHKVLENLQIAKEAANIEQDLANQLTDGIRWKLSEIPGIQPAHQRYWIHADVFKEWSREICGHLVSPTAVRNFARNGLTKNFDKDLERFPASKEKRRSGVLWIGDQLTENSICVIGMRGNKVIAMEDYAPIGGEKA